MSVNPGDYKAVMKLVDTVVTDKSSKQDAVVKQTEEDNTSSSSVATKVDIPLSC